MMSKPMFVLAGLVVSVGVACGGSSGVGSGSGGAPADSSTGDPGGPGDAGIDTGVDTGRAPSDGASGCTKTLCGGACVDVTADPRNCGACGKACTTDQTCQAGACKAKAGSFGGACTKNGDCDSKLCLVSNICSRTCASASDCPPAPEWRCAPLPSYPSMCQCTPSGPEVCDGRDNDCDGVIDNGAKCGETGFTCQAGKCACDPALVCGAACVDKTSDPFNCGACGNLCGFGGSCVSGVCKCPGAKGVVCAGVCHDLATDLTNCGACGVVCPSGAACVAGTCTCPGVKGIGCGGTCVDIDSSLTNCGACDKTCATGATCTAGTCVCPGADTVCGSTCRDLATDRNNCGTCGTTCDIYCAGGSCVTVAGIAGGLSHTCALLTDGTVECWGANGFGQLGDGTNLSRLTPVHAGVTGATQLALGGTQSCALVKDGTVWCWGDSTGYSPVQVAGLTGVVQISTGSGHACARLVGGTVECWGLNDVGQLGDGTTSRLRSTAPVPVTGLTSVAEIRLGDRHSCARLTDGTAKCWGANDEGQVGNGSVDAFGVPSPISVVGLVGATALALGESTSCAQLTDGSVQCWGNNGSGQLGNGTTGGYRAYPGAVTGVMGSAQLTAGQSKVCARLLDTSVTCWGEGVGTPNTIPGLTGVTAFGAGGYHTCFVLSGGSLVCMGNNHDGQLGDGTTTNRTTPVPVRW